MSPLFVPATAHTPEIDFNREKGNLKITGRAFTQNILEFYAPVRKWVDDYMLDPHAGTILDLKLEYINSASTMVIANLLKKLCTLRDKGNQFTVNWYFLEDEDDMKEIGHEMETLISVPFNFIPVNSL